MTRTYLLSLAAVALLGTAVRAQQGGMAYGRAPQAEPKPPDLTAIGLDQKLGQQVPLDLTFRDEHDQPITLAQCVAGKPTVLVLAYYRCPQLCTQVLNALTECLRRIDQYSIGKDFNVITVSFDPKERPALAWEKKQSYVKEYGRPGAEEGWHFLTGEKAAIDALTQAVGFRYEYDKQRKQYNHPSGLMILTPDGRLSRYFLGIDYKALDVRLGLVDMAGAGRISPTLADQVLLLCGTYDPQTGHYTGMVMGILRLVFCVFVIVLGSYLLWAWRRSRRTPAAAGLRLFAGPGDAARL